MKGARVVYQVTIVLVMLALVVFPVASGPNVVADAGARVVDTGSMAAPRAAHSATALTDGRVLIVGGCTLDGCELGEHSATAELYDPATGGFTDTGSMNSPRIGHTATLLPDGRVLIAGGWGRDGVLASTELYDPATDAFASGPPMTSGRGGFTTTSLPDGRILFVGGVDGDRRLASAELYDPQSEIFALTGEMGSPRSEHAAAVLVDGRVLVAGGSRGNDEVLASAEIYDPATGTFTLTGSMTVVRRKLAAVPLEDGRVLIVGGSDASDSKGRYASTEIFDPVEGAFSTTASMTAARFKLLDAVTTLPTGEVLVAGGGERAELYDPATDGFDVVAGNLGAARAFATATQLPDGGVLIAGGYDPTIKPTEGAWVYRPSGRLRSASYSDEPQLGV